MATVTLLTADEFLLLPDDGIPKELVQGEVVTASVPTPRHGEVCGQTYYLLRRFLDDHPQGRVVTNDSCVITEKDPDTVRGADVAFYSFQRVPERPLPRGYLKVSPELIFEVKSKFDRWSEIHIKVAEYLAADVLTVCVLDEETQAAHVFSADHPPRTLGPSDQLTFPGILDDFRVEVRRFFE